MGDHLSADVAAGAGPVIDDKLLADAPRKGVGDEPRDDVRRRSGRITGDDVDRPIGVGLGPGSVGKCW
jgi:hypothetical protein